MKHYFKVAEFKCCVNCEVQSLNERLGIVVSSFTIIEEVETENILTITKSSFNIQIKDRIENFDIELTVRDLYQIFYIFIALVVRQNNTSFLTHASVASKEDNGILIIGDYASGKTTLANTFEKEGYEVNAADRTVCSLEDGKLYNLEGTRKVVSNNQTTFLDEKITSKKVQIKTILFLDGISDNGDLKLTQLVDKTRIKKKLFYGMINVFFAPLENVNECMFRLVNEGFYQICKDVINANLNFIAVRGDANKIVQSLMNKNLGEING